MGRLRRLLPPAIVPVLAAAFLLPGCHLTDAVREASTPGADGRTCVQVVQEGLETAGKAAVAATVGDQSVVQCLLRFVKTAVTGPSTPPAPVAATTQPAAPK